MSDDEQLELPVMDERYFTTREVAEKFSVTMETVRIWTRKGKLRCIKIGNNVTRIPESSIQELAQEMYGD